MGSSLAAFFAPAECARWEIRTSRFFDEMYARPMEQIKLSFAKAAGRISRAF